MFFSWPEYDHIACSAHLRGSTQYGPGVPRVLCGMQRFLNGQLL